jgi:hypothetical protein
MTIFSRLFLLILCLTYTIPEGEAAEGQFIGVAWPRVIHFGEITTLSWEKAISQACVRTTLRVGSEEVILSGETSSWDWTSDLLGLIPVELTLELTDGSSLRSQVELIVVNSEDSIDRQGWMVEIYKGLPNVQLETLLQAPRFPHQPHERFVVSGPVQIKDALDNYGGRARSQFTAPVAGDYRFYVAGDDQVQLSLRYANSNRKTLANCPAWTGFADFDRYGSQVSNPISLGQGEVVELEVLWKERGGGDHFAVGTNYNPESQTLGDTPYLLPSAVLKSPSFGALPYTKFSDVLEGGIFWSGDNIALPLENLDDFDRDALQLLVDGVEHPFSLVDNVVSIDTLPIGKRDLSLQVIRSEGSVVLDRETIYVVNDNLEDLPHGLMKEIWSSKIVYNREHLQRMGSFPLAPDHRQWVPELYGRADGNRKGIRYRGKLFINDAGQHHFTIKSWGDSELWIGPLDPSLAMTKVAAVPMRVHFGEDIRYVEQVGQLDLQPGWHAIEVLQATTHAMGRDYVTVSMITPDGQTHAPIAQHDLQPMLPSRYQVLLTHPKTGYRYQQGRIAVVRWKVEGQGYTSYEIYDGDELLGNVGAESRYAHIILKETGERRVRLVGLDEQGERHLIQRAVVNVVTLDRDADDLSDHEEKTLGTDPKQADSDGDGLNDGPEAHWTGSDPIIPDVQFTEFLPLSPTDFSTLSGNWITTADNLSIVEPTGRLELSVDVRDQASTVLNLRLKRSDSEIISTSRKTQQILNVYLDHRVLVSKSFYLEQDGESTDLQLFLPHLPTGSATLELEWSSFVLGIGVVIETANLRQLSSDKVIKKLSNGEFLTEPALSSKVSPIDLEGMVPWLDRVKVNGRAVSRGAGTSWFTPLSLSTEGSTSVSIQLGERVLQRQIDWVPTIVAHHHNETLSLRVGDEIKLQAFADLSGFTEGRLWMGNQALETLQPLSFEEPGTFQIKAEGFNSQGAPQSFNMLVEVFPNVDADPVHLVHVPHNVNEIDRLWSWPDLPAQAFVESDGLNLIEVEPIDGQRTFLLDQQIPRDGVLVARLTQGGAILGTVSIKPLTFTVSTDVLGYMRLRDKIDDSTLRLEEGYFCRNFPENFHIEVHFWTSGAFFEDGSSKKTFTHQDFINGHFHVQMFKFLSKENSSYHFQTSACHRTSVYQGGQELFRF